MIPEPQDQIRFLQHIQRILAEGVFTATYKYALLLALADIAVERGDDSGAPLVVKIQEIAEKFVRYYWRQARPYQSRGTADGQILRQNTGKQAAIVTFVGRHQHSTIAEVRRDSTAWRALMQDTRKTIVDQPLWKLQMVGGAPFVFLYEHTGSTAEIELKGDAVYCLRQFYSLVYDLVTAAWVRFVRQLPGNREVLGHTTDLSEFLFGLERANLERYRQILADVQKRACFYCAGQLGSTSDVDHFIPWSRYPVDLGHNFVLAHARCNNHKRDRLAAVGHLERWVRRNEDHGDELRTRFDEKRLIHDEEASIRVVRWAYELAESAGSLVWVRADEMAPLSGDWRRVMAS